VSDGEFVMSGTRWQVNDSGCTMAVDLDCSARGRVLVVSAATFHAIVYLSRSAEPLAISLGQYNVDKSKDICSM
jgi:hypothetical protein